MGKPYEPRDAGNVGIILLEPFNQPRVEILQLDAHFVETVARDPKEVVRHSIDLGKWESLPHVGADFPERHFATGQLEACHADVGER